MKKLLLILMLFTVSNSVMAEWELVLKTKGSTQYVDRTTLRVSGNIAKMWTLTNISKRIESIKRGELADRLDGKAAQAVTGIEGEPITVVQRVICPAST